MMIIFGLLLMFTRIGEDVGGSDGANISLGIGLALIMIGLHFAFWSAHAYLDKKRGLLLCRSGLFGLGKAKIFKLSDFDMIRFAHIQGTSETADEYHICLSLQEYGPKSPTLVKCHSFTEAQKNLNALEQFLGWPTHDTSRGAISHLVETDNRGDGSDAKTSLLPPLPTDSKLLIKDMIGNISISYPCPNMMGSNIVSLLIPFSFVLFVFWDTLMRNGLYLFAFIGLLGISMVMMLRLSKRAASSITLTIDSNDIKLTSTKYRLPPLKIPLTAIRSVSLNIDEESKWNWSNRIIIQTHHEKWHEIAKTLSVDDTRYIYDVLKSRL